MRANLLVGSCFSQSILRYDAETGAFLSAFVPAGSGGLDCPEGSMLIGPDGNLYVTNFSPARITEEPVFSDSVLRYDGRTGAFIDVFISPSSVLNGPHGMAFGPDGNLYVGTRFSDRVLRYQDFTHC